MVAFINGEPAKKLYRKFKIEHEEARDDLMSMKEVIYRHYSRLKNERFFTMPMKNLFPSYRANFT